jgi:hypothetical protein
VGRSPTEGGVQVARLPAQQPTTEQGRVTPTRTAKRPQPPRQRSQVSIRASSILGIEPLYLNFSAECPREWQRTAAFLWTINGNPVCRGINGQKTLVEPGEHTLGLLVVTKDGKEHRASKGIRVLPRLDDGTASSPGSGS